MPLFRSDPSHFDELLHATAGGTSDRIVQGIVILGPDGAVRTMNPAALSLHGFGSIEEMRERLDAFNLDFVYQYPDGRPMLSSDAPAARSLHGEPVCNVELHGINRRTGEQWVAIYNSTPVYDVNGALESVVVTIQDITERKRTELELLDADRRNDMLVVAVTGWGQEEDRRRTAEAGFDAHFTKPVDFSSVMALIGQRRSMAAKEPTH